MWVKDLSALKVEGSGNSDIYKEESLERSEAVL
jgi:hypothetical protein